MYTAINAVFVGEFASEIVDGALSVTGEDYTVLFKCSSHGSPLELDEYLGESYASLFEKHTALHTPLYDTASIELADDSDFLLTNEQMLADAYDDEMSPALFERIAAVALYSP